MSRRVYLHIGAPKTGTTYLQDRLSRNVRTLAEHDVHFPSRNAVTSPGLSQFRAALDLLEQDWGGPPGHAEGAWGPMARKVRRSSGTVVLSHEILAPASPAHVARVHEDLRDCELHVVYSARDLGRQVPAAWQESIKQGRKWSYQRFCNRFQRKRPWFARALDLPAVLSTWSAGLPPERVHVVTVPHERDDTLWLRFCEALGIDPAWAPRSSDRANPSLGAAETQLLRKLNRRMERVVRREARFDTLIRTMLAEDRLVNRGSPKVGLPPRLHPWAVAEAERWREWIEGSGVHVVGDLADLEPSPPAPEDEYVDPDRVGAKRQLSAALDALAAMTFEAARRPDPDHQPSHQLRVKARQGLRGLRER